jgi:hypothetical protein
MHIKQSSQLVLNFHSEFARGIEWRLGFIDVGVIYTRHYLPDLVTYSASDLQPIASFAINLTALCTTLQLKTEMAADMCLGKLLTCIYRKQHQNRYCTQAKQHHHRNRKQSNY